MLRFRMGACARVLLWRRKINIAFIFEDLFYFVYPTKYVFYLSIIVFNNNAYLHIYINKILFYPSILLIWIRFIPLPSLILSSEERKLIFSYSLS
jgi:hypothetical protein